MTRDDHCTAPWRRWCDCDWCRYLRETQKEKEKNNEKE